MMNSGKLAGYTIFITGASRGIGKAIGLKAAKDGANIIVAAKTAQAHPKLPGTIYTAAKEMEDAGGKCLPCVVDIRDEKQVSAAVDEAVKTFGGIDIVINNASAISLTGTLATPMKKYDLMNQINARGTYLCSRTCLPHLLESKKNGRQPHILNISPPLSMKPIWFKNHVAYTIAKYGMSMCVLGMASELQDSGVAVNALWPRTAIYTAAMEMLGGGNEVASQCRTPDIMADAAYAVLTRGIDATGNFYIDDAVLAKEGIKDFEQYAVEPGKPLMLDFFLEDSDVEFQQQLDESGKLTAAKPPASKQSSAAGGANVKKVFSKIKSVMSEKIVSETKGIFKFQISGDGSQEVWFVDLKNASGDVINGAERSDVEADVTMTMKQEDFIDMFEGKLNSTAAFMQGKLKIDGNMMLAMKLEKLMNQMNKAKL